MAKNEKTSPKLASLAAKILQGSKKPTAADARRLAGGLLTQAADRKKK